MNCYATAFNNNLSKTTFLQERKCQYTISERKMCCAIDMSNHNTEFLYCWIIIYKIFFSLNI